MQCVPRLPPALCSTWKATHSESSQPLGKQHERVWHAQAVQACPVCQQWRAENLYLRFRVHDVHSHAQAVQACPVCQQWRAENPLIVFEALDFAAIADRTGGGGGAAGDGGQRRRTPAPARVSPKRCSVCGAVGHNRRACPEVRGRAAAEQPGEPEAAAKKRRKPLDPAHKQCVPRLRCACADVGRASGRSPF